MKKFICTILLVIFGVCAAFGFAACGGPEQPAAEPEQLPAPQNVRYVNGILSWDSVPSAEEYLVCYGDVEKETRQRFLQIIFSYDSTIEVVFKVKAVGDGLDYIDSEWGECTFTYYKVSDALQFNLLSDGSGYEVTAVNHTDYSALAGELYIPDFYNDKPVVSIADHAFSFEGLVTAGMEKPSNSYTTSVRLPEYLERIGEYAFSRCTALEAISVPEGVTFIGDGAFSNCGQLARAVIPEGLEYLGSGAFMNCAQLKEIVIPSTITEILSYTFQGAGLTYIKIPDTVTRIEAIAFKDCASLESVKMSANIEFLGRSIFEDTAWYLSQPDGYVLFGDILYKHKGDVPAGTEIEQLPADIKYIASDAFSDCSSLVSINLKGVSLLGQAQSVFSWCTSLKEVLNIPVVETLPENFFVNCRNLDNVVLPEGIKVIGDGAFSNCRSLKNISLPSTLEKIGANAFITCTSLKEIDIPDGVKVIESNAFWQAGIETLVLPEGLTVLENRIGGGGALTALVIPATVRQVASSVFFAGWGDDLQTIYYGGTAGEWAELRQKIDMKYLPNATIYLYSEAEPAAEGDFWHYASDGKTPVVWQ